MSVPFSYTHVRVPKGFGAILEDLAREVLRDQPDDIPTYAAKHFSALLKAREESGEDPVEWAARLENRFNNKCSFKSPGNQNSTAVRTQVEVKSTPPDHVEDKEPEDTQPTETFTLSPLAPDQEEALDSTAQMGVETADETEPPAKGQYWRVADVDISAQELKGRVGSTVGGVAEEEEARERVENVEQAKKADGEVKEIVVGDGEEEEGRGDEEGKEAGEKDEEVEEKTREEDKEVEGARKGDEEVDEDRKGDEEVDEARGGDEAEAEGKAGQGSYADVEEGESCAHMDADIYRSELEPSSMVSIGGLANIDVCATELEGQPDDQEHVSEGSVKEHSSLEASESELEKKELSASLGEVETPVGLTYLRAESPEHSHTSLEKRPEQQTCLEDQHEDTQEASATSEVTQKPRSRQEEHTETEADTANSGGASDGRFSPGGTDRKLGIADGDGECSREDGDKEEHSHGDGDGERSHGDGDGEGSHEDGDGELSHGDGDGEPGLVQNDGEVVVVGGNDEPAHAEASKEEGVCSELDSQVEDTDTDKPDSHEQVSGRRSAEKSAGHTSTTGAQSGHGGELPGACEGDTEKDRKTEKEEEDEDDDEVTQTDKDAHTSTLQDVSEIESTQRDGSDDECDVTQAAGLLDEHQISDQRESSATPMRSGGTGHDPEREETGESVEQPGSTEQKSDEKSYGEGREPEKESPEKPEGVTGVSLSAQPDASEEVGGTDRKQEADSEELGGGESTGKQEGEVKGDQRVQEAGGEETDLTGEGEGSLEQSLSDPAAAGSLGQSLSGGLLDASHSEAHTTAEEHSVHAGDSTQTPDPELDQSEEHNQDQSGDTQEGGAGEEKSCDDKCDPKEECNQPGDEEDIMDIPLDDPEANRAAAKIQAGFRGHMTRKKMPRKDDKPSEEVSSSGEALNGNQGNTGASEEAETEGTSAPEQ